MHLHDRCISHAAISCNLIRSYTFICMTRRLTPYFIYLSSMHFVRRKMTSELHDVSWRVAVGDVRRGSVFLKCRTMQPGRTAKTRRLQCINCTYTSAPNSRVAPPTADRLMGYRTTRVRDTIARAEPSVTCTRRCRARPTRAQRGTVS